MAKDSADVTVFWEVIPSHVTRVVDKANQIFGVCEDDVHS